MHDLPTFLQMFARLFMALALGAWLTTTKPAQQSDKSSDDNRPACEKKTEKCERAKPCEEKPASEQKK